MERSHLRAAQANLAYTELIFSNEVKRGKPAVQNLGSRKTNAEVWMGEPFTLAQIDLDSVISDIA